MRTASRIIGALLVVGGMGPFAVFFYVSLTEGWSQATSVTWFGIALFLAAGIGLMLAGRYYLRLDPDAPESVQHASPLVESLVLHRREFRVLAEAGLGLTVIRLVLACVRIDWPGRWADWLLTLGAFGLMYCGKRMADPGVMNNSDWIRVPQWIRSSLPKTSAALGYIALASILLEQSMAWRFPLYSLMIRVLFLACLASLYAVAALFFRYGELRSTHEEPS